MNIAPLAEAVTPTRGDVREALITNIVQLLGRDPDTATKRDWFHALAYYLRGRLSTARVETWRRNFGRGVKWNYYLSMELLPGKLLRGGRRPLDIYRRIYAGINGMPMPAHQPPK